jgi:hypothetical protein
MEAVWRFLAKIKFTGTSSVSCRGTRAFTTVMIPHVFQQSYNGFQASRVYCPDTRALTTVMIPHVFQQSYNGFQESRVYCPDTRAFTTVKYHSVPCVFRQSINGCQFSMAKILKIWWPRLLNGMEGSCAPAEGTMFLEKNRPAFL